MSIHKSTSLVCTFQDFLSYSFFITHNSSKDELPVFLSKVEWVFSMCRVKSNGERFSAFPTMSFLYRLILMELSPVPTFLTIYFFWIPIQVWSLYIMEEIRGSSSLKQLVNNYSCFHSRNLSFSQSITWMAHSPIPERLCVPLWYLMDQASGVYSFLSVTIVFQALNNIAH